MNIINQTHVKIYAFIIFLLFGLMLPDLAFAANNDVFPVGDLSIPGTDANSSIFQIFGFILKTIIFLVIIAGFGLGIGDSIFSIFGTIADAKRSGEWAPAIRQIGIIIFAVIFGIALMWLANKYVFAAIDSFFS